MCIRKSLPLLLYYYRKTERIVKYHRPHLDEMVGAFSYDYGPWET